MSFVGSNILAGASGQGGGGYEIERSLRFNSGDSSYLSKNISTKSTTFTLSFWLKRSTLSSWQYPWSQYDGSGYSGIGLADDNRISIYNGNHSYTTAVFRDVSAWYHLCLKVSSGSAILYVNNEQVGTSTGLFLGGGLSKIGDFYSGSHVLNGYLADFYGIDGQALAPTDFGETDDNGVWQPKKFAGTYGTNGFHLPFSDNSTSAALGTDTSGNSNTWTVNNISATAPGLATANQGMDVVTYTGNGGTQSISSLNLQPDFVWIKNRTDATSHMLFDSVRGVQKVIYSNAATAEQAAAISLTAFNSNGFTIGSANEVNGSGDNMVAWCWKAGGAASSNTDGTITSSVSANTTYGFSIVKFTMGLSDVTIGHGLAVEPKFIITKRYSNTGNWITYHASLGKSKYLMLNSTAVAYTDTADAYTSTNSSVFDARAGLIDAGDCISYVWSEVAGFSKFGSYTGNGSADGPVITTGFKPRWIMVKSSSNARHWDIMDSARSPTNPQDKTLRADSNNAEFSDTSSGYGIVWEVTDNGFKILRGGSNHDINTTGETYIYAAFAAKPDESGIDSLVDSPSQTADQTDTGAGGEVVGNYATLNPLNIHSGSDTFSNGNLENTVSSGAGISESTISMSSGKYYFESVFSGGQGTGQFAGIRKPGSRNYTDSYLYVGTGTKYINAASGASYGATLSNGDVIGTAFDATNGTLTFYKNGVSQGTAYTGITGTYAFVAGSFTTSPTYIVNFGQRAFAYTAPSGYKALCTANLPEPTIADGSKYFDTKLWAGDGASTRTISNYGFSPDFIWIKNRTTSGWQHVLYDQIRGAGTGSVTKSLSSDSTRAEASGNDTNHGYLSGYTSDGFNLVKGSQGGGDYVNHNGWAYVGWAWDAGTSTVTNNDGSIASQVRAQPSAGFSIVSYSGNSTSGATVGHSLNSKPELIIIKATNTAQGWATYHGSVGANKYLQLNATGAAATYSGFMNSTEPTTSVFSLGNDNFVNTGSNYIAYCFAPVANYSAMGSYSGNGSTDGLFVYTGFRPAFILIKNSTLAGSNWIIIDTSRDTYNESDHLLKPNSSNAEQVTTANEVDILSNGFKPRGTDGDTNGSGNTIIYLAVAENPFKTARAR